MKRHIINEKSLCKNNSEESENTPIEIVENNKNSDDDKIAGDSWAEDQNKKSYYYDDSYGYEVYDPDEDDEKNE